MGEARTISEVSLFSSEFECGWFLCGRITVLFDGDTICEDHRFRKESEKFAICTPSESNSHQRPQTTSDCLRNACSDNHVTCGWWDRFRICGASEPVQPLDFPCKGQIPFKIKALGVPGSEVSQVECSICISYANQEHESFPPSLLEKI